MIDEIRYFICISNDPRTVPTENIVFQCNKRCDQENLISQLNELLTFLLDLRK